MYRSTLTIKAEQQIITAEADARAITTKAEAEAEANTKIAESLTDELIQYMETNQWNGQLPSTYIGGDYGVLPIINPD